MTAPLRLIPEGKQLHGAKYGTQTSFFSEGVVDIHEGLLQHDRSTLIATGKRVSSGRQMECVFSGS